MTTSALSIFTSSAMLLFVVVPVACAPDVPRPLHEKYVVIDLTRSGVSAPYDGPLPSKATRTFVPWDDTAILEVQPDGDSEGGALVVRYGKSWWEGHDDGPWRIYLLEAAGPEIEPISIEWKPKGGSQLHAIARVDGELRRYDFGR